jgi:16S rRNA (guanine527-N7)-methyltransferase
LFHVKHRPKYHPKQRPKHSPAASSLALTPKEFKALTNTKAADVERLGLYLDLLKTWQSRINLVSDASLADPWRRHMLDSAQLIPLLAKDAESIVDLGSGAGFPGLVIAILTGHPVHLIDSDARKCVFLREAGRLTNTLVQVHNTRIERLKTLEAAPKADIVTARALAPLPHLLAFAAPILKPGGRCLFLKGQGVAAELTASEETWKMRLTRVQSRSDPSGTILVVDDLHPRG